MNVVVTILAILAPELPPGVASTYFSKTPPKYCDISVGENAKVCVVLDTKGKIVRQARVILVIPPGNVVEPVEAEAEFGSYLYEEKYESKTDGSTWIRLTWRPDDPCTVNGCSIMSLKVRAANPGEAHVISRFTEIQAEDGTVVAKTVNNATKIRVHEEDS